MALKIILIYNIRMILLPSFYAHIINGLLLLVAFIILLQNYNSFKSMDKYRVITLVLLFSIAVGVHGISHLGLEKIYGYNPLQLENR
jgi:hypothetical protein